MVFNGTTQGYFHSSLFAVLINSEYRISTYNNASSNNFDFDNEKIHYTSTNSMIHNILDAPKIMDYENTMFSGSPNQKFHLLSLFKTKHTKELNFPTLIYEQPRQFSEGFSYQQIAQWELIHKSKDFSTNILNLFLKLLIIFIQKVIGSSWVQIRK